ncbi:hypothetical protein Tco_0670558 [Tanacetum coccineum]
MKERLIQCIMTETLHKTSSHLCAFCYNTRDGENLDKMKEKRPSCQWGGIFYSVDRISWFTTREASLTSRGPLDNNVLSEIKEMILIKNSSEPRDPKQRQEMYVLKMSLRGLVLQGQKASDYDNSDPVPPRQNVVPTAEKTDSSQQGLEFLFSPLLEDYYNPTHGLAEENHQWIKHANAHFKKMKFTTFFVHKYKEIG